MPQLPTTAATRALDAVEVDYRITHHGRVNSAEEAATARGIPVEALAKSLVVRVTEGEYVVVLIPANRSLDYPKLRTVLGVRRLTMPSPEEAKDATGYERGTITPLGAGGWPTFIDRRLAEHQEISVGSGVHGWAIALTPGDLVRATEGQLVDVAGD